MPCASCTGAYDVPAACNTCLSQNSCPSCNACQGDNSSSCTNYNTCLRCTSCNTRCNTCQALCETQGQTFTSACGNAYPGDHWINVARDDIIVKTFPQGKFYWAWEWLRSLINYGAQAHSPGSSIPPSNYAFLQAAHWNQLNTVMQSIKAGDSFPAAVKDEKVTASKVVSAGQRLQQAKINKIACHYQNTVWDTCGPTSSQCCQTCLGCMTCTTNVPVTCSYYGCQSCNTCLVCNSCQGCVSCQSCVSCQTACNSCNNCNSEQSG